METPDRPKYSVIDVSPAIAKQMLGQNIHNRSRRAKVVSAYALDMAAGDWRETGDSIKFAVDGTLLDGQHRLEAIIRSRATIPLLVVRGLPPEIQENIDGGLKRNFADVLNLRGESHYNALAAITRRVALWDGTVGDPAKRTFLRNDPPTNAQMSQALEKYPWLRETAVVAVFVKRHISAPASTVGFCHWLFTQIHEDDCVYFFEQLAEPDGLGKCHPIVILREMLREQRLRSNRRVRITETVLTAYCIKGWNAYREGREITFLRYSPGGARPELFPLPH